MLDEVIQNLTCSMKSFGFKDNTVLIISGDNGGNSAVDGNNYPFRGYKYSYYEGGIRNTAIIHSPLIPSDQQGSTYDGLVFIADWLPTFMRLATDSSWNQSYAGNVIDGYNIWDAIVNQDDSPREEIVINVLHTEFTIINNDYKYMIYDDNISVYEPSAIFTHDYFPDDSYALCTNVSLVSDYVLQRQSWIQYIDDMILSSTVFFDILMCTYIILGVFGMIAVMLLMKSRVIRLSSQLIEQDTSATEKIPIFHDKYDMTMSEQGDEPF